MPLVVAIVPDADQAEAIASIVGALEHVELLVEDTARTIVERLGDRTPDLVLTAPFVPPSDEALIGTFLRERGLGAAHVQTVTIPLLDVSRTAAPSGILSSLRAAPPPPAPGACPPDVFLEQVREYLQMAMAERRRLDAVAGRQRASDAEGEPSNVPRDAA